MWKYTTVVDAEELLNSQQATVIFKHSTRCSISSMALDRVLKKETVINESANVVLIDVIRSRPVSLQLAKDLNVEHASPQLIIVKGGKVIYTESHKGIKPDAILAQL